MRKILLTIVGLALAASFETQAKSFRTDFISLDLPPAWDCVKEELDWVCQPENLSHRSEAIVVVVVKNANPTDDKFEIYETILKEPRDMTDLLGNPYKSEVKYVRYKEVKNQQWVDSLTLGSEIPGFYSRYMASIKGKVAGLVTYSIAESVYAKWAPILDKMVDSLEIHFDPKAFNEAMNASPGSLLGSRNSAAGRFAPQGEETGSPRNTGDDFDITTIAFLLLLVGGVIYFIKKKKQGA